MCLPVTVTTVVGMLHHISADQCRHVVPARQRAKYQSYPGIVATPAIIAGPLLVGRIGATAISGGVMSRTGRYRAFPMR
jgi:hypothetical protein